MKIRHSITRHARRWVIALVAAFGMANGLHAQQATPANPLPKKETVMSLPTNPQDVWERILILMKRNQGFVSKQDVEEVMGMRFTHTEKDGELRYLGSQFFHSFKQDVPGLGELDIGLFDDPEKVSLGIGWGARDADRVDCPQLDKAIQDISSLGWVSGWKRPSPGTTSIIFWRASDVAESRRPGGKPLSSPTGISELFVGVPYESSQCVVRFGTTIYL